MRDAIQRIDDRARQIVHRVRLVLFARHVVRLVDASVDGRVTHGAVR